MNGTIADVRCPTCGAPARFDIIRQQYCCGYCGGSVEISEAIAQKQGFRSMQQEKIRRSAEQYRLMRAGCPGCGAEIVFEENEAISVCAFCGKSLVRGEYLSSEEMPEMILPFRLTREEAAGCLESWCRQHAAKSEARHLKKQMDQLQGCYLPYELIRGPVTCEVSRMDATRRYRCSGYIDDVFVNGSKQLDNLLLDGMEPFELDDLQPFDFAYAAGQRIKIRDVDADSLKWRVKQEISSKYTPEVRQVLQTGAVEVWSNADSALRMPVLLPVYYLNAGGTLAAVNGQTGKVSVRADRKSYYLFLPWWLKAILATLVISGAALAAFRLFGMDWGESLMIAGMLAVVTIFITLCAYSDTVRNSFRVESERKIFTSSGGPMRRVGKDLIREKKELRKEVVPPVFFETLDGTEQPVQLVFSSFVRRAWTALLALIVLFLPVIVALFLNGFDFARLELGGSAVWFYIMVPVVPIYLLKFAVIELYDRPWIYRILENGKRKRYRKPMNIDFVELGATVLKAMFVPPVSLAVWFGLLCFGVMCYLTAFGFD